MPGRKALVHALVFTADLLDPQDVVGMTKSDAILHPADGFYRVAFGIARQCGRAAVVDGLHLRLDAGR